MYRKSVHRIPAYLSDAILSDCCQLRICSTISRAESRDFYSLFVHNVVLDGKITSVVRPKRNRLNNKFLFVYLNAEIAEGVLKVSAKIKN